MKKLALAFVFLSGCMGIFGSGKNGDDTLSSDDHASSDATKDSNVIDEPPAEQPPVGDLWSQPSTWASGEVPKDGDEVTIPFGKTVLLDVDTANLDGLTIDGSLNFDEKDLNLSASWVLVHGDLTVGRANRPFPARATMTLTGTDPNDTRTMGMGTRGIMVMGGALSLHSAVATSWTKLADHALAGATSLKVLAQNGWRAGDKLVIAPTDFYSVGHSEVLDVASVSSDAVSGDTVQLVQPLQKFRWGKLQYITDQNGDQNAMTLTPTNAVTDRVLDERAEVGNLTRNIVIQSIDDNAWQADQMGAHVMIMEAGSARIEGVEVRRAGQAGLLGRYPIHFHRLSHAASGQLLADVTGQYVKNSAVWNSTQRCIVIHATNGLTVENNICYDVKGHAIFLEDAVERRNRIVKNLVLTVRQPDADRALLVHERNDYRVGVSGYWIANPDNIFEDNVAADSEGNGFWFSFPLTAFGSSRTTVTMCPACMMPGSLANLVTHSNRNSGVMFDGIQYDDAGHVQANKYKPTEGETLNGAWLPFTVTNFLSYKHVGTMADGAFWNNSYNGTYAGFMVADFADKAFKGASNDCVIQSAIVIGYSLNDDHRPANLQDMVGVASYHSECDIADNLFVNLPYSPGHVRGAFSTDDYYITPVDLGLVRNTNNRLINAGPGLRMPSPNITGSNNNALSGALWDPSGHWGAAGNYWVYNLPFVATQTTGQSCTTVSAGGQDNGLSCPGPYYGMMNPQFDYSNDYVETALQPLNFTRLDTATSWNIGEGFQNKSLQNMRHAAAVKGGIYTVDRPQRVAEIAPLQPRAVAINITNMIDANDHFVLGLPYFGNAAPQTALVSGWLSHWDQPGIVGSLASYNAWKADNNGSWRSQTNGEYWHPLMPVSSRTEVENSDGTVFWWDQAGHRVWVRCTGGVAKAYQDVNSPSTAEWNLYKTLQYMFDEDVY